MPLTSDSTGRTLWILAALVAMMWFLWRISEVLPPFVVSVALALLLDPVLDRLQQRGLPRWAAVTLAFGLFMALFFGVLAYIVPLAIGQVADLLKNLDLYSARLQSAVGDLLERNESVLRRLNLPVSLHELQQQYGGQLTGWLQLLLQRAFVSLQISAGMLGWVLVVPIVTLYLLIDLDRIHRRLIHLVPPQHREAASVTARKVGNVFSAYLRGLTGICVAYGAMLILVLGFGFRLPYALILGIVGAVLYAVPYLGQMALLVSGCIVAWASGHNATYVGGVAIALVAIGQLFDQLVTPRVVGRQVGLHPVLGLFALMVGGHLFGLGGMVLAVPVAACLRVVLIDLYPRLGEALPDALPAVENNPSAAVAAADGRLLQNRE